MQQTTTGAGQQPNQQPNVEESLERTLRRFNEAFNRFDAPAVASFWAEDGTLINPIGNQGEGRSGVERVFRDDAQTILEGSTSRFTVTRVRPIGRDCAFLDCDHDIQNWHRPDGTTGPMKLHLVVLAQRKGDGWQWLDARPYAFRERPPSVH